MAIPCVRAKAWPVTWVSFRLATLALALALGPGAACRRKATEEGSGTPGPAAGPRGPDGGAEAGGEPATPEGLGSPAAVRTEERAAADKVRACVERDEGCDAVTDTDRGLAMQFACREERGTRCDALPGAEMHHAIGEACRKASNGPCSRMSREEFGDLLLGLWGVPACRAPSVNEHDKLRLPISLSREPAAGAAKVEVQADSIYCNGMRSAMLREEHGIRTVDEKAKAGGRSSYVIGDLQAQLEDYRRQLEELERSTGRTFDNKEDLLLFVDGATPVRVVKEVLFTAKEAGYGRFQLVVRRAAAAQDRTAARPCGDYAAITLIRGAATPGSAPDDEAAEPRDASAARIRAALSGGPAFGSILPRAPNTSLVENLLLGDDGKPITIDDVAAEATAGRSPFSPEDAGASEPPAVADVAPSPRLRLVAILTKESMTVMAGRDVASAVIPEDPVTGTSGRIDIPHLPLDAATIEWKRAEACPTPTGAEFDECAHWTYMAEFFASCFDPAAGAAKVPDLRALHLALRGIAERADAAFPDGPADRWLIDVKSEDDIPLCRLVGILDFARFRDFAFDWPANAAFRARYDELLASGARDPLLDPVAWSDELRPAFLFPLVGFVN